MTLTELPEWAWWAVALAGALVYVGIALVIALAVAGAISLRERAPRPARWNQLISDEDMREWRRLIERQARRQVGEVISAVPTQRAPERGRRRVPCAPGRPCGLHHPTICVASPCCFRCPQADPRRAS